MARSEEPDPVGIRREMAAGGIRSVAGQGGTAVFGVVVYVVLTRLLPPQDLGIFLSVMAAVLLAALTARLGLGPVLTRAIASKPILGSTVNVRNAIRRSVIAVLVASFVLGIATWLFVSQVLGYGASLSVLDVAAAALLIVWIASLAMEGIIADAFRGFGEIGHAVWVFRLAPLMLASGAYAFILVLDIPLEISDAVTIAASSSVVVTIAGFVLLMSHMRRDRWSARTGTTVSLRQAFPVWISSLGGYVSSNIGLWAVIILGSAAEVAVYGLSTRLVAPIVLPLVAVNGFITPIVASLHAQGERQNLESVLRSTSTISSLVSVIGATVLVAVAPFLLSGLFGPYYERAYPIVAILTIGAVANVFSGSPGATLLMTGHQWVFAWIMVVGVATGIVLGVIGYQQFGVLGVAAAASLVTSVQVGAMTVAVRRRIGVWTIPYLRPSDAMNAVRSLRDVSAVTARWR